MMQVAKKPFSWSWSRLKNFRSCPRRHYEIDLAKNYKDDESEALIWGNQVHEAMAKRIHAGIPLPPTMQRFEDWPGRVAAFATQGTTLKVENKLAMDANFGPTSFFDNGTWFRCVIDVLGLLPADMKAAFTIDWKTGSKVDPEFEQLALSSQVLFAHYPHVQTVLAVYVWLGHDTQTVKVYDRGDMAKTWADLLPEVAVMKKAQEDLNYPPKPSGLCKRHCPVKSCPNWGVGSR